jgi:hypothetical protein
VTGDKDPYVRVYSRIIDDPKFETVYDDDARLACWLRLLILADATWPTPADPRGCSPAGRWRTLSRSA